MGKPEEKKVVEKTEKSKKTEFIKIEKDKLNKLYEEVKESKNDYLRVLAEFENFRKIEQLEKIKIRDRTIKNFVIDLLPSIENFEVSLKAKDNVKNFIIGVEYIHKNLLKLLEDNKIKSFEPKIGDKFDPKKHDPIPLETKSEKEGEVLGIVKKGYIHNDLILVPAKVHVKKVE
jgi:molecular chaperone GrpE